MANRNLRKRKNRGLAIDKINKIPFQLNSFIQINLTYWEQIKHQVKGFDFPGRREITWDILY